MPRALDRETPRKPVYLPRQPRSGSQRGTHISLIDEVRRRLAEIPETLNLIDQLLRVAGLLTLALDQRGMRPILVGGAAVAIYTKGSEATFDVDFVVADRYGALDCFSELGFEKGKSAGVWWYPRLKIPVEIPDSRLAGDIQRVVQIELEDGLMAYVVGIEDLILDRAEQAYAQHSPSSDVRRQAIILIAGNWDELDMGYLLEEAEKRGILEYYITLRDEARSSRRSSS